jgi:uncharacterized protein
MNRLLPTALITGASSGIGKELARVFAENHYQLVIVARDQSRLEALAAELHQKYLVPVRVEVCDLADRAQIESFIKKIESENFVVDVLVNNAGVGVEGPFTENDWSRELEMINLNITALARLTKAIIPQMVNRRSGRILQMASTAAFQPGPYLAVYFATKAFVLSFSEALTVELKGTGVSVTAFCPGLTESEFERKLGRESALFNSGLPVSSVRKVAEHAYANLMNGRRLGIHGILNRILAILVAYTPRFLTLGILSVVLSKKKRLGSRQPKNISAS